MAVPISVKNNPSQIQAIRRVKAAIREDRDIDPDDYRIAKRVVDRQMDAFHSIPATLFLLAASVYVVVQFGWRGDAYAVWYRIMWWIIGVLNLIIVPSKIAYRVRTARWIARHELTGV